MTSEPEPLTPGVHEAAYRLGWALERAGRSHDLKVIAASIFAGRDAYSEQAEAERIERIQAGE